MKARESTQVFGINLPKQTTVAFKREAAGRNVCLNQPFKEMWDLYSQSKQEDQSMKNK